MVENPLNQMPRPSCFIEIEYNGIHKNFVSEYRYKSVGERSHEDGLIIRPAQDLREIINDLLESHDYEILVHGENRQLSWNLSFTQEAKKKLSTEQIACLQYILDYFNGYRR